MGAGSVSNTIRISGAVSATGVATVGTPSVTVYTVPALSYAVLNISLSVGTTGNMSAGAATLTTNGQLIGVYIGAGQQVVVNWGSGTQTTCTITGVLFVSPA